MKAFASKAGHDSDGSRFDATDEMEDSSSQGSVDVVVSVSLPGGSVEHFHHFLLGFLTPLVFAWAKLTSGGGVGRVFVRSCAIFDPLLAELGLPKLTILPREQHAELVRKAEQGGGASPALALERLRAYDTPQAYDRGVFNKTRDLLVRRLSRSVDEHRQTLAAAFPKGGPRIVFINREAPDPFYASERAEIPTAGAQRRSIPNFREAHLALIERFGSVLATTLEGKSLAHQIALFQLADIVICQHGAALANLIWSETGAVVVEIMPRHSPFRRDNRRFRAFQELARCLSLDYRKLQQPSAHGAIDAAKLVELIAAAASSVDARRSRLLAAERRPRA